MLALYLLQALCVCHVFTLGESVTCSTHIAPGTHRNLDSQCVDSDIHFTILIDLLNEVLTRDVCFLCQLQPRGCVSVMG